MLALQITKAVEIATRDLQINPATQICNNLRKIRCGPEIGFPDPVEQGEGRADNLITDNFRISVGEVPQLFELWGKDNGLTSLP